MGGLRGQPSWTFIESGRFDPDTNTIEGADGKAITKDKVVLHELSFDPQRPELALVGVLRGDIDGDASPL